MSISSLPLMKEVLGLNPTEEDWLQYALIACSPYGDFIAIASEQSAVFYVKKFNGNGDGAEEKVYFKLNKTYCPHPDIGNICAIECFPVRVGSGRSHDIWYCVVIGFDTGIVHFVTADGQLLIAKQFCENKRVVKIRVLNSLPPKRAKNPSLAVSKLSELLIVYESTIASVDNTALLNALINSKSEAAQAKSRGVDFQPVSVLPARKWIIRDQDKVNDVAAFSSFNISFDQLHKVSMNKQLLDEEHLKSLGYVVTYISIGQDPFIQFNSPHPLLPPNINELAHTMVSTVKSGLLKAATGFFWGSSSQENEEQDKIPADPERKLETCFNYKDPSKEASQAEISPDCRYTAIFDEQNRVLLIDNASGLIVQVWKGYHHAQFGWIHTLKDKEAIDPSTSEFAILLAIYLPRRGLLEIWSPEQKSRVAHFPVSKRGQLLTTNNTVLDMKQGSPLSARTFSCGFLDPDGKLFQIFVPIHALTDKSSSHDSNLQAKLKVMLEEESVNANVLIQQIKSAKASMSKLLMMRDILRIESKLSVENSKKVLNYLQEQMENSNFAKRHIDVMSRSFALYDFLRENTEDNDEKEEVPMKTIEDIQAAFKCSHFDAMNFVELNNKLKLEFSDQKPTFTQSHFMACFHFLQENDDEKDFLPLRAKNTDLMMLALLQQLSVSLQKDYKSTLQQCLEARIRGEDLLMAILRNSIEYPRLASPEDMFKLFQLSFDLHQSDQELGSFQSLLQIARRHLIKCDMQSKLYYTILLWKSYLLQSQEMSSYAEDWNQILHFTKAFLIIKNQAKPFLTTNQTYSFNEVFNGGSGKIVEVITSWLVDANFKHDDLEQNEQLKEFFPVASDYFPASMNRQILVAHLSWEYCHRWNKDRPNLDFLEDCVQSLFNIGNPELEHRLTRLLWNVILSKPAKDAVNLTEIRSASRCEREMGFSESDIPQFLDKICDVLGVHQKTLNESGDLLVSYDVTNCDNAGAQRHLIDILSRLQVNYERDSIFGLFHQMAIVSKIIWYFGLDVKPLTLFSNQEVSLFFQSGLPGEPKASTWSSWAISQNRGVRNARKRFLEISCQGAVQTIQVISESETDSQDYNKWSELIGILAMHWNMVDRLSEVRIVAMYKAGYDSLGEEILCTMADKETISRKLLRIAMLRLSKNLVMAESDANLQSKLKVVLGDEVKNTVKELTSEVDDVALVELGQTANLLVALTNNDLSDVDQQTVYDWLAVAQTLIRSQS